jgi:enoyl-CoA hydratase
MGLPDMQYHPWMMGMRAAMEQMLTGDSMSGEEAARLGWANRAYPLDELETRVLEMAERVAKIAPDHQQLNKRAVHRAMEVMGVRTAIRYGSEVLSLALHQRSVREYLTGMVSGNLTDALDDRDKPYGDYRRSTRD